MLTLVLAALRAVLVHRAALVAENIALRQQLAVLRDRSSGVRLRRKDRAFWVALRWAWGVWRDALVLVQPATVMRWHREGFRLFWRWKSRPGRVGRPRTLPQLRDLIREMNAANPLWGAPRLHGELCKLGIKESQRTVGRLMGSSAAESILADLPHPPARSAAHRAREPLMAPRAFRASSRYSARCRKCLTRCALRMVSLTTLISNRTWTWLRELDRLRRTPVEEGGLGSAAAR